MDIKKEALEQMANWWCSEGNLRGAEDIPLTQITGSKTLGEISVHTAMLSATGHWESFRLKHVNSLLMVRP